MPDQAIILDRLERSSANQEKRLELVEGRIDRAESRLDVIGAKIGVYATLGSILGGAVSAAVAVAIFH